MSDNWADEATKTFIRTTDMEQVERIAGNALPWIAALTERVHALEATNAALVAFVEAADELQRPFAVVGYARFIAVKEFRQNAYDEARQTLATDHGIPLPGQEG